MSVTRPGRSRHRRLALAAVALLLAPAPVAQARPRAASAGSSTEHLLREGEAALQGGDLPAAERALEAAYRARATPAALFQLGRLALKQGRLLAAQDLLRRALATTEGSSAPAAQRAEAERALATPQPGGELAVLGEPGALVLLDDHPVGVLPLPLPLLVPAGAHQLRLSYPRAVAASPPASVSVQAEHQLEVRFERDTGAVLVSERKAVLLLVDAHGAPGDSPARIQQAAVERLRSERLTPVLAQAPAGDCRAAPRCQLALLAERALPQAVVVEVSPDTPAPAEPATAPGYRAACSILDAQVGEVAARSEKRCPGCTPATLASLIDTACAEVVTQGLGRPRGELTVDSEPAGATLELSGRVVGPTPYHGVRFAGSYAAVLRHPGYREYSQSIAIQEGQPTHLRVQLERPLLRVVPVALPAPQRLVLRELLPRPRWRLFAGGGLLAFGLASASFGAAALSIDGQCVDTPVPPSLQCEQNYATLPLGAGLLGAGAAASVVGALLLAVPGPHRDYPITLTWRPCPPDRGGGTASGLCVTPSEGGRR